MSSDDHPLVGLIHLWKAWPPESEVETARTKREASDLHLANRDPCHQIYASVADHVSGIGAVVVVAGAVVGPVGLVGVVFRQPFGDALREPCYPE